MRNQRENQGLMRQSYAAYINVKPAGIRWKKSCVFNSASHLSGRLAV